MSNRIWNVLVLIGTVGALCVAAFMTAYIDPFFHFHAPNAKYQYRLDDERHQNDGIVRNFTYDAVITGSSMTENFSKTLFDDLFQVNSVKVPLRGGSYKEINDLIKRALKSNPDVKIVLRSVDYSSLINDKDDVLDMGGIRPKYLYDDNPFNDVEYLLNKEVLLSKTYEVMRYTHVGGKANNFDEYANWSNEGIYGYEAVEDALALADDPEEEQLPFTEEDKIMVRDNVNQNLIQIAKDYPDTTFYLFFTPYSVAYWAMWDSMGKVERILDAEKMAIEMMLEVPNIKLYTYTNRFDIVTNFNNYKDTAHFGGWINRDIMTWMAHDLGLLTKDNYKSYCDEVWSFYTTYPYDTIFY